MAGSCSLPHACCGYARLGAEAALRESPLLPLRMCALTYCRKRWAEVSAAPVASHQGRTALSLVSPSASTFLSSSLEMQAVGMGWLSVRFQQRIRLPNRLCPLCKAGRTPLTPFPVTCTNQ